MTKSITYAVGGTVQASGGLYITRQADEQLFTLCLNSEYAYILTTRQVGKSSLMIRTAEHLSGQGVSCAIIDLAIKGINLTPDQWYLGILSKIEEQLMLSTNVIEWWQSHANIGITERFMLFFEKILLAEILTPIVIFIDEIDTTRSLSFADDFYILIRSMWNIRAENPRFNRLSFVLIGVATPYDLIQDINRTPFNVASRIDLSDFTFDEALPLADGLGPSTDDARQVLKHILKWTNGHPYLTLLLCKYVASEFKINWSEAEIDRLVVETFFGEKGESDSNLRFVGEMLTKRSPDMQTTLTTYLQILLGGRQIRDEGPSLIKTHLKLSGVVRCESGVLLLRNQIYENIFNRYWVKEHLPVNWYKRLTQVAATLILILLILSVPLGVYAWHQRNQAISRANQLSMALRTAEEQSYMANQARQMAEQRREEAEVERQNAQDERTKAFKQGEIANQQRTEAVRQRQIALHNKSEVERQRNLAIAKSKEAEEHRHQAEYQRLIAERERGRIERDESSTLAAIINYSLDERQSGIDYLNQTLKIKRISGNRSGEARTLNSLGSVYAFLGDKQTAIGYFNQALPLAQSEEDRYVEARTLTSLGGVYASLGEVQKSLDFFGRALLLVRGEQDRYGEATTLNDIGLVYLELGEGQKAFDCFVQALKIRESAYGPDHPEVAVALTSLSMLYRVKGNYSEAESLSRRALGICEKSYGEDHPLVAESMNNLARLYYEKNNFAAAEQLNIRALDTFEKKLGPQHIDVAISLNSLADIYRIKGDYEKSELFNRRALSIFEKVLGTEHPLVATALNSLAALYFAMGKYTEAEPLNQRALNIYSKLFGSEHPEVAVSISSLAALHRMKGDYTGAELLIQRALAIYEKKLGPVHPRVGTSLNNLADLYYAKGDFIKAESLTKQALGLFEKIYGPEHYDVATSLNSLAAIYFAMGKYSEAEPLNQRALAICERLLGPKHPLAAVSLNNLTAIYEAQGDSERAISCQSRALDINEHNISLILTGGLQDQRQTYKLLFDNDLDRAISLHIQYAPNNTQASQLALTTVLRRKGRLLDASIYNKKMLQKTTDPKAQALVDKLVSVRAKLASLFFKKSDDLSPQQSQAAISQLEAEAETLETEIGVKNLRFRIQTQPVTLEGIQELIPQGAALVEMAAYRPFNVKAKTLTEVWGPARYASYILKRDGELQWLDLGEVASLDRQITLLRHALTSPTSKDVKQVAHTLYNMIMRPICKLLGDTKQVLLSPDGSLNLVPFGALVDENDNYLIERYSLTYLTSGRDLLRLQVHEMSKQGAFLLGDPSFDTGVSIRNNKMDFMPLPGAADEVRIVAQFFPTVTVLTQSYATEKNLKEVKGPSVLHIATHGFFLPDTLPDKSWSVGSNQNLGNENQPGHSGLRDPMLRAGLALAGANAGQSGEGEDGILTALEAAGLDLWGTKLVVLSACDTGVGELHSREGVYGLRRAFVIAGSESQVTSLWTVYDSASRDFMVEYYKQLNIGETRSEALRKVQLSMLANPKYNHPFFWANFILSGNWTRIDNENKR